VLGAYGRVLRAPHVASLVVSSVVARLPLGINSVAILLFVREQTGSLASAGLVQAAFAVGSGGTAPLLGRLVDRVGQTRVLVPGGIAAAAALAGLVFAGWAGAGTGVLALLAFLSGAAMPPVAPALRTLWPRLVPEPLHRTAFALDSVLIEIFFIAGPLIAALAIALASPGAAILLSAGLALAGNVWFSLAEPSRAWRGGAAAPGWAGALGSPALRTLVLSCVPAGASLGALEVALPAFAADEGEAALAGVLLAVWSLGSLVGGVAYGVVRQDGGPATRFIALYALLPVACAPLALAPGLPALFVLAPFAGLAIAPLIAARNDLARFVADPGTLTEAFSWLQMATVVGIAGGAALSGVIADEEGARAAIGAGIALAAFGAVAAAARRGRLDARAPAPAAL
jgi:MFS family permease